MHADEPHASLVLAARVTSAQRKQVSADKIVVYNGGGDCEYD
jgi:hypothetical protein